jgi:hypothetical protein
MRKDKQHGRDLNVVVINAVYKAQQLWKHSQVQGTCKETYESTEVGDFACILRLEAGYFRHAQKQVATERAPQQANNPCEAQGEVQRGLLLYFKQLEVNQGKRIHTPQL